MQVRQCRLTVSRMILYDHHAYLSDNISKFGMSGASCAMQRATYKAPLADLNKRGGALVRFRTPLSSDSER